MHTDLVTTMTGFRLHQIGAALLLASGALVVVGCSRKPAEPAASAKSSPASANAKTAAKKTTEIYEQPGAFDPNDPKHGTRKLMNLDAPVYVDGAQASVLRYGDLVIKPFAILEGETPSYAIYDYLKSIGIAPETIKSIHLHGNNDRIASIEGSELVKQKDRFTFTFSSQTTGAPIQRWDTEGLKNEFVVHEIRKVSVFVKKAPFAIHPQKRCHLDAPLAQGGKCTDAMPYADKDPVHGTRVYVDGKMVGFVKRRQIQDAVLAGKTDSGDQKYNVAKFVESLGVKISDGVKSVELVAGDDVVARASAEQFDRLATDLFFVLPKHNHGKVRVHVPYELQAGDAGEKPGDRDALVSSVHVYKTVTPAERPLVVISEDTDLSVQLASNIDVKSDSHGSNAREGQGER
jgi:hypothetical protein